MLNDMSASKRNGMEEQLMLKLSSSPMAASDIRKSFKDVASYLTPNKTNKSINLTNMNS
jgi:hypothetical protein